MITPEMLRKILSSADVLFCPSRHEGFGLLVIEAMACGCPVIMLDAIPLGIDGESVLKCETGVDGYIAALRRILLDKFFRAKVIESGLALARQYSLAESREKFEAH